MQQLWNRQRKQNQRWQRAKVENKNHNDIPHSIEKELVQWFRAPSKKEQEKQKLRPDLRLSADASRVWEALKNEREAAIKAQGQKFEAKNWWLEKEDDDKGKKTRAKAAIEQMASTLTILGVKGLEYVTEDEEGKFILLSPEGSVTGVEEEEGGEGSSEGLPLVLPIRGPKSAGSP